MKILNQELFILRSLSCEILSSVSFLFHMDC